MAITANFQQWFAQVNLSGEKHEDVCALYNTVRTGEDHGRFQCIKGPTIGAKQIVPLTGEDTLLLVNDTAQSFFLRLLAQKYSGIFDLGDIKIA